LLLSDIELILSTAAQFKEVLQRPTKKSTAIARYHNREFILRKFYTTRISFGRPKKVELCVLINPRYSRQLPIQPDYCGKSIDSIISQKVGVEWDKEEVNLY